jgi:Alpha amylase, catalytic domain
MTKTSLRLLPLFLACALCHVAPTQTLARPGWVGSGMSADLWWQHAVVYHVNPANFSPTDGSGLHGITQRLDYLHSLGVDALLLTPIQLNLTHAQSIDLAYGTLDDLDDLIHEASRHNIRVLLDLDPQIPNADMPSFARFWLNRGIAGFHVIGSTDVSHTQAALLHKATDSYLGQRIVIADVDPSLPPDLRQRTYRVPDPQGPQLILDTRPGTSTTLSAATIRPAIDTLQDILQAGHSLPLLATDGPAYKRSMSRYADGQHDLAIAKVVATLLFTTRAEPLLYYGQELGVISPPDTASTAPLITWDALPTAAKGKSTLLVRSQPPAPNAALQETDPNSLLNWYRQLSTLRHSNAAVSAGAAITLNHDDQNTLVWVRKPQNVTTLSPAVVVICNLSAQSVQLSLKSDMQRLHLRGSFLRTVLRTDNGRGPMDLDFVALPPYAVYIGELRY